jgi:hypothetical protein
MTSTSPVLFWAPRVFAIASGLFLSMFALDAFAPGKPLVEALPEALLHLTPAALVFAVVALAWRRDGIGAFAFVSLALLYVVMARSRVDWIVVIAGPLLVTGLLFLWNWSRTRRMTMP